MIKNILKFALVFGLLAILGIAYLTPSSETEWALNKIQKLGKEQGHVYGLVWRTKCKCFVTPDQFYAEVSQTQFVLIGEKHGNVRHHAFESMLVGDLSFNRNVSVGFEMFENKHDEGLKKAQASNNLRDVKKLWSWGPQEMYSYYAPIIEIAFKNDAPIFGANESKRTIELVVRQGLSGTSFFSEKALAELYLDHDYPDRYRAHIFEWIRAFIGSHANHPIENYVDAQRLRDARIAYELQKNKAPDGTILIAGIGHVHEGAVPWYLKKHLPSERVVSIGLLSTWEGEKEDYEEALLSWSGPAFDYLISFPD